VRDRVGVGLIIRLRSWRNVLERCNDVTLQRCGDEPMHESCQNMGSVRKRNPYYDRISVREKHVQCSHRDEI
jgi:hypothetical protein